ncbi:hypothetical protein BH20ACI2_BH20ACI2_26790 [soil metagenome]
MNEMSNYIPRSRIESYFLETKRPAAFTADQIHKTGKTVPGPPFTVSVGVYTTLLPLTS